MCKREGGDISSCWAKTAGFLRNVEKNRSSQHMLIQSNIDSKGKLSRKTEGELTDSTVAFKYTQK